MTITHARVQKRKRAVALAAVASGRLPLRDVIWDGYRTLETCPVHRVLEAAPGMGPEKTRLTLERANVWPLLPFGELHKMQRSAILAHLPRRVV